MRQINKRAPTHTLPDKHAPMDPHRLTMPGVNTHTTVLQTLVDLNTVLPFFI